MANSRVCCQTLRPVLGSEVMEKKKVKRKTRSLLDKLDSQFASVCGFEFIKVMA